jgi:hypothetical protein
VAESTPRRGRERALGALLVLLGVSIRVWNAAFYPAHWGFDGRFNWEYLERLRTSWALPAPHELWAAAHPPLFYYTGALLSLVLGNPPLERTANAVAALSALAGLLAIALCGHLVWCESGEHRRTNLALLVLLFLPVHVYASAMLNEEMLAASLGTAALYAGTLALGARSGPPGLARAACIGALAGLALLTKLSGLLVVVALVASFLWVGVRSGERGRWARCATWVAVAAGAIGGGYYLRNLLAYGYLYPYGLEVHDIMFTMPPGDRGLLDYVRVPLATWLDPQLLHPDLLRSVWGSTYATAWFDGHRMFLPRALPEVRLHGTALTVLGLLPTLAFLVGLARGIRRIWRREDGVDALLVAMVALCVAGYVLFTWRNPWFASLKASYLLPIALPFAFYASEALAGWMRRGRAMALLLGLWLAALVVLVALDFSFGLYFRKSGWDIPGLEWQPRAG